MHRSVLLARQFYKLEHFNLYKSATSNGEENYWTDARRPVPRLWIRSAKVGGGGVGVTSLGEWEHNNNEKKTSSK